MVQSAPESITQKIARLEAESISLTARLDQVEMMNRTLLARCERAEKWVAKLVTLLEKEYRRR